MTSVAELVQPSLAELESAASLIYKSMPPTPQYRWPLLDSRVGTAAWVKHENHTPIGAFKVRGGVNLVAQLSAEERARVREHLDRMRAGTGWHATQRESAEAALQTIETLITTT